MFYKNEDQKGIRVANMIEKSNFTNDTEYADKSFELKIAVKNNAMRMITAY